MSELPNLIVPIFSMRSYETGKYSVLKDGNFQLHLSRMDRENDLIAIPENVDDYAELIRLGLITEDRIIWLKYSQNAYLTRKEFWNTHNLTEVENVCSTGLNLITDITGYIGQVPVNYNFNITAYPGVSRPFIDEFLDVDVLSINNSEGCTVLNTRQKEVLENSGANPDLITVNQEVISPVVLDILSKGSEIDIGDCIFFPFRLTDGAYKFEETVEKYKDRKIIITDPNNSYSGFPDFENVRKISINKNEYYRILKSAPTIIYNEDPSSVFHPGLAELIYFSSKIISPYDMPDINELIVGGKNEH